MRTETITHIFKTFSELTEENQLKIVERNRDKEVCYEDWCEHVLTDATEVGKRLGIDIQEIQYSGFWSQGDGARFRGFFKPKSNMREALREYAPVDEELHGIADRLAAVQEDYCWLVECEIAFEHWGHYVHDNNTRFEFEPIGIDHNGDEVWMKESDEQEVKDALRRLMRWIYRQLEKQYEYLTGDEHLLQALSDYDDEYEVEIEDGEEILV
jgi:hypothetical protein